MSFLTLLPYLDVIGTLITNAWNAKRANDLTNTQIELSNNAVQRRYTDLEKAGINPILAAQGQAAAVPSGVMVSSQNPFEHLFSNVMDVKKFDLEKTLANSTLSLNDANIKKILQEILLATSQTSFTDAQTVKSQHESLKLDAETAGAWKNIDYLDALINNLHKQGVLSDAQAALFKAETKSLNLEEPRKQVDSDFWSDQNKNGLAFLDIISRLIKAVTGRL